MSIGTVGGLVDLLSKIESDVPIYASSIDKKSVFSINLDYHFIADRHIGLSLKNNNDVTLVSDLTMLIENIDRHYSYSVYIDSFSPLGDKFLFTGHCSKKEGDHCSVLLELTE